MPLVSLREYWMTYRGPSFLAVVWFGSSPTPPPHPSAVSKLSLFLLCVAGREGGEREVRGGTELYNRGKSWPSNNHSILSGFSFQNMSSPIFHAKKLLSMKEIKWTGKRIKNPPNPIPQSLLGSTPSPSPIVANIGVVSICDMHRRRMRYFDEKSKE